MAKRETLTAYGPMVVVAAEQSYPPEQRIITDELALRFLLFPVPAFMKPVRWAPIRNFIFHASAKRGYGVWAGVLCRKWYIDEKLAEAVRSDVQAVVILGAGLDTHAYRSAIPGSIPIFEVDLPENVDYKRRKVRKLFGEVPSHVRLVPVDFNTQDLGGSLTAQGYPGGRKCLFIWEGVTQYLAEDGVRKTMDFLSKAGHGSRLVFTYILEDFIRGVNRHGLNALYAEYCEKRIWKFGLAPGKVSAFLKEYGWKEMEQIGGREYTARYLEPIGRTMPVTEIERAVYAEKVEESASFEFRRRSENLDRYGFQRIPFSERGGQG